MKNLDLHLRHLRCTLVLNQNGSHYIKNLQSMITDIVHLIHGLNNPSAVELSWAGFFYLGNNDTVVCFFCGKGLHLWNFTENAFVSHKEHSPDVVI